MNVCMSRSGQPSAYCFIAVAGVVVAGLAAFVVLAFFVCFLLCFFVDFFELFVAGALLCVAGAVCASRALLAAANVGTPSVSARAKVASVANIFFMV